MRKLLSPKKKKLLDVRVDRRKDGSLYEIISMKNDFYHGAVVRFYRNCGVSTWTEMRDDKMHGRDLVYSPHGVLAHSARRESGRKIP